MALVGALPLALANVGHVLLGRPPQTLVDLGALPDSVLDFPNLVVLEIDPEDLEALVQYPLERGQRWERPARIAFVVNGDVRYESPVGVRVHGGVSRTADTDQRSFRLHFRDNLNAEPVPGRLVGFEGTRSHRELVLHGDERGDPGEEWHYANPMAYEILRRVGVLTPETAPVRLVINGGQPLPYVLTEYVDVDYLEARFGHRDFVAFDAKNRTPEIEALNPVVQLRERFGDRESWTFDQVRQVVDMDSVSRWFIAALYCGSRDMWQGRLVRDQSDPEAKWFWIAQDFDQSFGRPPSGTFQYPVPQPDPVWEDDQFALHLPGEFLRKDERVIILDHLFRTSEPFRQSFADLFSELSSEQFTRGYFDSLVTRYEELALANGIQDTKYIASIREWFAHRPIVVEQQVVRYTGIAIE